MSSISTEKSNQITIDEAKLRVAKVAKAAKKQKAIAALSNKRVSSMTIDQLRKHYTRAMRLGETTEANRVKALIDARQKMPKDLPGRHRLYY